MFSRTVRHRIALERYSTGEVEEILRLILEIETDTLARLTAAKLPVELSRGERIRIGALEEFLRELRGIYAEGYARIAERGFASLDDLAIFEAEFQSGSLAAALDDLEVNVGSGFSDELRAMAADGVLVPTVTQLRAVVRTRPLQNKLLEDWFSDMEADHFARAAKEIQVAFVEGEGIAKIAERLQDVTELNARGAEAVARTAITHVASEVAQETYAMNEAGVARVEWVAVLDTRTTQICRARDGKRYPLDSGPRPPAHIRCRSAIAPVLEGMPEADERRTYNSWLTAQPARVQDEILGPTRGRLFREGGLDVQAFSDPDGQALTLDEIRALHPEAFRRARVPA